MSPRWLFFPAPAASGATDLIQFTSTATSPGNAFNSAHTNLTANTLWNGRGLTNSIDIQGSSSPDRFFMWFNPASNASAAIASFSSFDLVDTTDSVTYALTTAIAFSSAVLFTAPSGANSVWVASNVYKLQGIA